jgi:hypothetical protein
VNAARLFRRAPGLVVAVLLAAALRFATAAPLGTRTAGEEVAQVRLSLSARPERIERCRELSDDELAKLPAHMRMRTQCEGYSARYLLRVSVGEREVTHDTLRGGGLRHDRRLHVFQEHLVSPGQQRLLVEVTRLDEGQAPAVPDTAAGGAVFAADTLLGGRAEREREERTRRVAEAMPQRLVLDTLMNLATRGVVLITFNNETRRLTARTEP